MQREFVLNSSKSARYNLRDLDDVPGGRRQELCLTQVLKYTLVISYVMILSYDRKNSQQSRRRLEALERCLLQLGGYQALAGDSALHLPSRALPIHSWGDATPPHSSATVPRCGTTTSSNSSGRGHSKGRWRRQLSSALGTVVDRSSVEIYRTR